MADSVRTAKAPGAPSPMTHQVPSDGPTQDPWRAFGYITAGVAVYGAIGFALDWWLGTRFLVAVGIIAGAGFGIYQTWARLNAAEHDQQGRVSTTASSTSMTSTIKTDQEDQ
jgi:ATP synthase protein I